MNANIPQLNVLYYKNMLDNCFQQFFEDFNDQFMHQDDVYVYSNNLTKLKLKNIFKSYLKDEVQKYFEVNSISNNQFCFIIGSCLPKDNILLQYKDLYFPEKLQKILNSNYNIKYFLKEKDVKIDILMFNTIFDEIFCEFFKHQDKMLKTFGNGYTNLFFLQHRRIDCLTMYRTIKKLYGRSNVVNLHKKFFGNAKTVVYSINECIDMHVQYKKASTQSDELKLIAQEIGQYIFECMKTANGKKQTTNIRSI